MTQYQAVKLTIEKLGGMATLSQINSKIFEINDCKWNTKTPFASIRRIVQTDADIVKIRPGLYALKGIKNIECSSENTEFTHSYFQGLLCEIGQIRGFDTTVPPQDKNHLFINTPLKSVASLAQIPSFSYEHLVRRAATIDVSWFNKNLMPAALFEVEHSTDISNSLLKFNDLQDFYTRMFIIADEARHGEFDKKLKFSAFKTLLQNKRVQFLSYKSLAKQHEMIVASAKFDVIL